MSYHKQSLAVVFAAFILGFISVNSAFAQVSCRNVKRDNPNYEQNMDKLAKLARLPDNYWSRYHEDVVSGLCSGNIKIVDMTVDGGVVKLKEVQSIARVLGKSYKPKPRSKKEKRHARERLSEMGDVRLVQTILRNTAQRNPILFVENLAKQIGKEN